MKHPPKLGSHVKGQQFWHESPGVPSPQADWDVPGWQVPVLSQHPEQDVEQSAPPVPPPVPVPVDPDWHAPTLQVAPTCVQSWQAAP
jgi:hypothetical protein